MIFICENADCPLCGKEYTYLRNKYKYVDGRLVSNNAPCPKCGKMRREIDPDAVPLSQKNIDLLKYDMASPEERKKMLQERSHQHFKRHIEEYKRECLSGAVKQFKQQ